MQYCDYVKTFMGIVSGLVAGVFGATGWFGGFFVYVLLHVLVHLGMVTMMKWDTKAYINVSLGSFVFGDLTSQLMSFLLFWTLAYGLVHVY